MPSRGPYAKGVVRRAQILETALQVIEVHGYGRATVREIAGAVGLSENGLLHYFGSKDALFTEILRRRDDIDRERYLTDDAGRLVTDLPGPVRALVAHNAAVPGFAELYARLSNDAAEPHHPSHAYFRDRYKAVHQAAAEAFGTLQAAGQVPADLDPRHLGVMVFALIDGLQLEWLYDQGLDMPELIDELFRALGLIEGTGDGIE